jgi:hypothetical protein
LQYSCCKKFASAFAKYDLNDIQKGTQEKKIRIGYQMENVSLGMQFDQKEQRSWAEMDGQVSLGILYSGIQNSKIGLENSLNTK